MIPHHVINAVRSHWNTSLWSEPGPALLKHVDSDFLLSLAADRPVHYPYLTLVRDGEQAPLSSFTVLRPGRPERLVVPGAVSAKVAEGYTLKMSNLERFDPEVLDLVGELERELSVLVQAYAFLTPHRSRGLSYHRDGNHVLVSQVQGTKTWHLWEPSGAPRPDPGAEPEPGGTLHTFRLDEGDYLYFPHGWPHAAESGDATSVHITFTLGALSPVQLLRTAENAVPSPSGAAALVACARDALGTTA